MPSGFSIPTTLEALNKLPETQHGVDIFRVKEWYLSGLAKHYRQTIMLSSFASAELNALFNRLCVNHAGKVKLRPKYKVRICSLHTLYTLYQSPGMRNVTPQ